MEKWLRKPANWQDFESLYKKLWGEIWERPDKIKRTVDLVKNSPGLTSMEYQSMKLGIGEFNAKAKVIISKPS